MTISDKDRLTMTDKLTTTVYGYSDDLVELDGAIEEEFSGYDHDHRLAFDNGAVLIARYDRDGDGIWRIENPSDHPSVTTTRCEDREGYTDPDGPIYSDLAIVTGATTVQHSGVAFMRDLDRGDAQALHHWLGDHLKRSAAVDGERADLERGDADHD